MLPRSIAGSWSYFQQLFGVGLLLSSKGTGVTSRAMLGKVSEHRITSKSAHVQVQGPALKVTALFAVTRLLFGLLADSLSHS